MEQSSPLAAMQPPSVMLRHHFRSEAKAGCSSFPAVRKFGPDSFNFRDLSMKTGHSDYFNTKALRGSSPTVSLAADLSQNFHIDKSPQLATPRRSLFTASLFGPENGRGIFSAEFGSRIPSRLRFSLAKSQQVPCTAFVRGFTMDLEPAWTSTGSLAPQPPPFRFAAGSSKPTACSSLSLSEMFEQSPPRESSPRFLTSISMGPPRPRAPFSGVVGQCRSNGSPVNGIRKSSNPFCRPRKQSRRSLSMFEHPEDIVNQEEDTIMSSPGLQPIADIDSQPTLQLPHFIPEDGPDQLPRVESSVLVDIINGKYNDCYDKIMIIDCRFEYEYEGGHINGAVNYTDKEHLAAELFDQEPKPSTALIFHCEYSAHRAPIMAKYIRHRDRAVNVDIYPKLTYPEMYILNGGYSSFFAEHRALCYPQNYVEMSAKEHEFACERGLGKVKQRSKLSRAQTFAFGQNSLQIEESPTGRCRPVGDRSCDPDAPFDRDVEVTRLPGRRMFSY
ncbi:M-phase inducer phosphatase 3 [Coccidioides immitis RMSCC 3703]|uniref:M-phase inducer phosphatase n=1 Tax=Coccidioides immitis RMSCC 3703 TaxID=454286 RepID=A0A0J8QJU0_COCIT|nr:M-phase inducer phosphatase 3 [Coccidioides immitis RMSCC 3703]